MIGICQIYNNDELYKSIKSDFEHIINNYFTNLN
jgi:hypothetical protein